MTFGQFTRLKRREAGIIIANCASALDVGPDTYLKKERGKIAWSLDDVTNLAAVYGLKASELLAEYETVED